jgi:hypothetical protein
MLRFRDVWLTRFPRLLDSSFGTTRNPVNPTGEASARRPVPLPLRASLVALLALVGVNALAGGYYAVSGAPGVPVEWLRGTPFQSYLIPGLILFCVVGGSAGFAAWAVVRRPKLARRASIAAGAILLTWIVVQVLIIGYVSWLQPAFGISALLIIALGSQLPAAAPRA